MKKDSFWSIYKDFWKKSFDYKSYSSLREYWVPVGFHLVLTALTVLYYLLAEGSGWSGLPFWILLIYLLIALIPTVALTVRRLKDTGLSGLWALLLLFVGAGTCVVLALCAAGSGFLPHVAPVSLYGPPPIESTSFDPRNNTVPALYGPPPTEEAEKKSEESTGFDPGDNTAAPLYGPPPTTSPTK